jgi:hypothetical protein
MSAIPDLRERSDALRVRKRPMPVRVAFAREDGVCATLEGPVRFRAGDAILTAAPGESWPVSREAFLASYSPDPPTTKGSDGVYRKAASIALALRLEGALDVPVGWLADPLRARPGDWLLRYADGAHGVVRDEIFRATYGPAPGETRWPPRPN